MDIDLPDVVAEVRAAFDTYERALVANDVETLDAMFRDDARTIRFGGTENLFGYAEIKAFRAARPPAGLARALSHIVITTYRRDPLSPSHHARQGWPPDADLGALPGRLAGGGGACERDRGGMRERLRLLT